MMGAIKNKIRMLSWLLAGALLFMQSLSFAATIEVTTFDDENGTNSRACSLREAIFAAGAKRAYGGCTAGQPFHGDSIKLNAVKYAPSSLSLANKVYKISSVLKPTSDITIEGEDPNEIFDEDNLNPTDAFRDLFTRLEPRRVALKTKIQANETATTRLFDTTDSRTALGFTNVILSGGRASGATLTTGVGGAIRAGGSISLNRVRIENSYANITGGAIYLEGSASSLSATDSEFKENHSNGTEPSSNSNALNVGATVLGMSCVDNLVFTKRTITFTNTSMHDNGSSASQSVLDICGNSEQSQITSTTIAQNMYGGPDSAAIRYGDYLPSLELLNGQIPERLYAGSSLTLTNITLVENTGIGLLYSDKGTLQVNNSVLAFNIGKDCSYQAKPEAPIANQTKVSFKNNMLSGTAPTDDASAETSNCQMLFASGSNNVYVGGGIADYFSVLTTFDNISLPGYIPLKDKAAVDYITSASGCPLTDQRGVSRSAQFVNITTTISTTPSCDIGAIELSQLTSTSVLDAVNVSYLFLTKNYRFLSDEQKAVLTDRDKKIVAVREKNVRDFIAGVDASFKYRMVYIHIFDAAISPEAGNDGKGVVDLNGIDLNVSSPDVTVTTRSLGQGTSLKRDGVPTNFVPPANTSNVQCEWDKNLKAIKIWYTGTLLGQETPAGEVVRCQYTMKVGGQSADGLIETQVRNVAPFAFNKTFIMPYQSVSLAIDNILVNPSNLDENDTDDGDGPLSIVTNADFPRDKDNPAKPPKPAFYQQPLFNAAHTYIGSHPLNIRIVEKPVLGRLQFEFSGPCPDNNILKKNDTCYGGKLTYHNKNTFSPFNDRFNYQVIDADLQSSNIATIRITNTATTTDDTRTQGGAVNLYGLLAVLLLAGLRCTRKTV